MKGFAELSAVALSLLAATVFAEEVAPDAEAAAEVPSDVKVLTTDTFAPFLKENPLVLAECKEAPPPLWLGSFAELIPV